MSSAGLIVCETVSQLEQITDLLLCLGKSVNGGGEFFSHAVFSALASVAISSKLRDFIIAPSGESIKELKRDIEQEIDKVTRGAQIDDELRCKLKDHYQNCKASTDDLSSQFDGDVAGVEKNCRIGCYIAFTLIIILIAFRIDTQLGALNLLCLTPLLHARIRMGHVCQDANTKLDELRNNFNNVRNVCQSQYDKEQADTDASIQKKLAPKPSVKRTSKR